MKNLLLALFITFTSLSFAQEVNWLTIEEAQEKSLKKPRPLLIDVYTDWCGWCKRMDKDTYSKKKIADYINENYYPVKFNAEQRDSVRFANHTFKFVAQGKKGYHELAAALLNGKMSYPSTVFLTGEFEMIQNIPGYQSEKDMYPILVYLNEGKYQVLPYDEFLKDRINIRVIPLYGFLLS